MPLDPRKHDAGDYIDDFMKSDAPQFKGKSKEQIRKMAIAAYLDAKREKGMEEGKLKQDMLKRQDMAKLASLYSKAMRAMPGSPKQKALKKQIDQYRRELGLNESVNEYGGPKISRKDYLKQKPMDEGLKDGYIVYKKIGSGINKIKKVATLKTMPKGKALDKVLDKYDADGVMAMSKALRNKVQVEAVSPAQQAAIAIAKKEKGEKPKEESRAYRDAMRGLRSKSATRGMATTKKDRDNEASDDDRKAASKNIIMQLRKAADSMTGADVEFEKGKGKVSRSQAQDVLAKFNRLPKPRDKEQMQKSIKSLADIKKILGR